MALSLQRDGEREGLRVAKLFRQYRVGTNVRCCDLAALCEEDSLECVDSRFAAPGYAALLMRSTDGVGGLIALQPGQDRGRRRFSIAHELGHYHIPRHKHVQGYCADRDMRARSTDARRQEWEANDFATELLMPRRLFADDARKLDVSVTSAIRLGVREAYDVSVMAAAWRIVQVTREPAAMVVCVDGRVEWFYRSDAFSLPLTERGQRLHADTLAAAAFRERSGSAMPHEVDPATWLDSPTNVRGSLLESTHYIPSLNQVISVLWLVDIDREED